MRSKITCLAVLLILLPAVFAGAGSPVKEKAAILSAEKWVSLVDKGEYAKSWQEAATLFKKAVSKKQWDKTLRAVREPLGKVISRQMKAQHYTTALPGAPDGEYVVMQFATSYANKKQAVETVTVMLDKDGKWRAAGYYIK